ncbi:MAG: hypothetical protein ABI557_08300 [Aureliella sp.]
MSTRTTEAPQFAVLRGMIGLEFSDDTFTYATDDAPASDSALYQVFIQSPAENQLVIGSPLQTRDRVAGWKRHDQLEDRRDDRWQRATLVVLALTSGNMFSVKQRIKSRVSEEMQPGVFDK